MINYYEVLGVEPTCTPQDIKKSFRRKAKLLHPDIAPCEFDADEKMRLLLKAYETLSDPDRRRTYDDQYRLREARFRFDYREYLRRRSFDPESRSKLIFYDLLHHKQDDAIEIYERFVQDRFSLADYLEREDYMDCAFLLAEQFERRGRLVPAYQLLRSIVEREFEQPYFRHFFDEVVTRLRVLTCFKMPGLIDDETTLGFLRELAEFNFSNKDTAFFLKKMAEMYSNNGENDRAAALLRRGLSLDNKLSGVKKLKQKIGFTE